MKKVILMMILIFIFVSVEVNAVEPKYMCVYGDSITAGYGLKDNADNFADILKKEYHLAKGTDFFNYSVSGATSSATLKQIKNTNAKVLQKADTIIISAGGNDIIDSYGMVLSNIVEQYYKDDIENAGISLGYNSPVRAICQLSELHENEIVSKIFDECMNARDFYKDTVDDFNKNINEMVKYIREKGSNADIYFLTLYNPISVFSADNDFFKSLDESVETMHKDVIMLAENDDRVHIIDVLENFTGHYPELTNINDFDIHPNKDGHYKLYELVNETIKSIPENPEEISENSAVETVGELSVLSSAEKTSDNGYLLWIFAGAGAVILTVSAIFIVLKRNKDK